MSEGTDTGSRRSAFGKIIFVALLLVAAAWPVLSSSPTAPTFRSTVRGLTVGETTDTETEQKIANRVKELWDEFLNLHPEKTRKAFRTGATEEEILEVENVFGVRLPPDYRAFLKICNGARWEYGIVYPPPLSAWQLLWQDGTHNDFFGEFDTPRTMNISTFDGKTTVDLGENYWDPSLIAIADMDGRGLILELETGKILWWDHDGWTFNYCCDSFTQLLEMSIEETKSKGAPVWGSK